MPRLAETLLLGTEFGNRMAGLEGYVGLAPGSMVSPDPFSLDVAPTDPAATDPFAMVDPGAGAADGAGAGDAAPGEGGGATGTGGEAPTGPADPTEEAPR